MKNSFCFFALVLITISLTPLLEANWSPPLVVSPPAIQAFPKVAIDSNSNSTAVWLGANVTAFDKLLSSILLNGSTSWSMPATTIDQSATTTFNFIDIFLDANGNRIAAANERDALFKIISLQISRQNFGDPFWSLPIKLPIAPLSGSTFANFEADLQGNVVVGWTIPQTPPNPSLTSFSVLPAGAMAWSAPFITAFDVTATNNIIPGLAVVDGNAFALWKVNNPQVAIQWSRYSFSLGTWEAISTLNLPFLQNITEVQVGMDAFRNVVAIVIGPDISTSVPVLYAATLDAQTNVWSPFQLLSDPNNFASISRIAVDSRGDAVAIWTEFINGVGPSLVKGSDLPLGGTWSSPIPLSQADVFSSLSLASDSFGNVVAAWGAVNGATNSIEVASKAFGENWVLPPTTLSFTGSSPIVDLNDQGTAVVIWRDNDTTIFASIFVQLFIPPPSNFLGQVKKSRFLNRTNFLIRATWEASPSPTIVLYRIYKNNQVIAQIPANQPFVFKIPISDKRATEGFSIVAVDINNRESSHIPLTIVRSCHE